MTSAAPHPATVQEQSSHPEILPLGTPSLRRPAQAAGLPDDPQTVGECQRLLAALDGFRSRFGFGRAIAAPQIGIGRRVIAVRLPGWPAVLLNPVIRWRSAASVTLWDDCMCFPDLLVRVSRAASISISFHDMDGKEHHRSELDVPHSELLQHEIDHLDGVLAVDRALGADALVSRAAFLADIGHFRAQVDYAPESA